MGSTYQISSQMGAIQHLIRHQTITKLMKTCTGGGITGNSIQVDIGAAQLLAKTTQNLYTF